MDVNSNTFYKCTATFRTHCIIVSSLWTKLRFTFFCIKFHLKPLTTHRDHCRAPPLSPVEAFVSVYVSHVCVPVELILAQKMIQGPLQGALTSSCIQQCRVSSISGTNGRHLLGVLKHILSYVHPSISIITISMSEITPEILFIAHILWTLQTSVSIFAGFRQMRCTQNTG
jgi:hypothetical protein